MMFAISHLFNGRTKNNIITEYKSAMVLTNNKNDAVCCINYYYGELHNKNQFSLALSPGNSISCIRGSENVFPTVSNVDAVHSY